MKKLEKIKSEIATTSLVLTFTILATIVILPITNAHDPPLDIDTYAYLAVQPNPLGVDQTVCISMWIDKVPPTAPGKCARAISIYNGRHESITQQE